jgi:hypothetical protein
MIILPTILSLDNARPDNEYADEILPRATSDPQCGVS